MEEEEEEEEDEMVVVEEEIAVALLVGVMASSVKIAVVAEPCYTDTRRREHSACKKQRELPSAYRSKIRQLC